MSSNPLTTPIVILCFVALIAVVAVLGCVICLKKKKGK